MTLRQQTKRTMEWLIIASIFCAVMLWLPKAHALFWWRRTSLFVAGLLSLVYLLAYSRQRFKDILSNKTILAFVILSTGLLLLRSPWPAGLIGQPLVHPGLLSLLSAIAIGLFLQSFPEERVWTVYYYAVLWWALVCLLSWTAAAPGGRLGFVDSQVIYASYLFMTGIIIGHWLWVKRHIGRYAAVLGISFLTVCLVLSQTRSALGITLLYFAWYYRRLLSPKLGALVLTGVVALALLLGRGSFWRLHDGAYFGESVTYRQHLVQASLPTKTTDWIFGGGVGSIEQNITNHARNYSDLAPDILRAVRFESSHNYLVDVLVERGIVITVIFARVVIRALRKQLKDSYIQGLLLCTVGYLLVNNINLQMELALWVMIVWICYPLTLKRRTAYAKG